MSDELAALGPFFAVDIHDHAATPPVPWQRMSELINQPDRLDHRVRAVRAALAHGARRPVTDVELRVAASVTQLGLVARLLAPAIAAATAGFGRIRLNADDLWWQDRLGGPFPLSVTFGASDGDPIAGSAVEAITAAVASRYSVADRVLWGNIASAVNSAAQLIARARSDLAQRAQSTADTILADPRVEAGQLRSGPRFRRRSCCLIYRVANTKAAVCGDCVLLK
jgi:hypothetical protein